MELITKIAENNVEVVPTKTIMDTTKRSVEVYDYDNVISYGETKITEDEKLADEQLAFWTDSKKVEAYVASQIEKYTNLKNRITEVKTKMVEEPIKEITEVIK